MRMRHYFLSSTAWPALHRALGDDAQIMRAVFMSGRSLGLIKFTPAPKAKR